MSITTSALSRIARKANDKRKNRKAAREHCPARPDGRRMCNRAMSHSGDAATCGRRDCAEWMLAQDEATVERLLNG